MGGDMMEFPDTVEEFMEEHKMVDRHEIYSNGIEYVPIFRMKQWFEHCKARSANAKRCIDAGEIEKHMNREEWKTPDEKWWPERELGMVLDSIPTADVVPYSIEDGKITIDLSGIIDKIQGCAIKVYFGSGAYMSGAYMRGGTE